MFLLQVEKNPLGNVYMLYRKNLSSEKLKQLQESPDLDDTKFQTIYYKENHKNVKFTVVITDITEYNEDKVF